MSEIEELKAEVERLGEALAAFGPLLPPSQIGKEVFENVAKNPDADMHAVPNQWVKNERSINATSIEGLEDELAKAQAENERLREVIARLEDSEHIPGFILEYQSLNDENDRLGIENEKLKQRTAELEAELNAANNTITNLRLDITKPPQQRTYCRGCSLPKENQEQAQHIADLEAWQDARCNTTKGEPIQREWHGKGNTTKGD